jgi:hypothetical protein
VRPGVVSTLRDFVPLRPLTRHEALMIAERQALTFLTLVGATEPPFPEQLIADLPRLEVRRISPFPASGATQWIRGRWVVVINGSEPETRGRFSLAHELKHILDHPFVDRLYGAIDSRDRHDWIEQVCDYFAGCLLVPRPWLKRSYTTDTQDPTELAERFGVSRQAMVTRLRQVGLAEIAQRCDRRHQASKIDLRRFSSGSYSRARRTLARRAA